MPHPEHPNLHVLEHPLIQDKLARIRDRKTKAGHFRSLVAEVAGLMVFQASRDLPIRAEDVETPLETVRAFRLAAPVTIVPILRAGMGLADGVMSLMPEASVGHIGLYRDEASLDPVSYYIKLPEDVDKGPVFLVDPMLATGGSAAAAVNVLREHGCEDVRMICLVAAPEGVRAMEAADDRVLIYTAALDRELNDLGYILPGLGDAGDRMFGTR
ncbi:MAG: uracil phosphoribosyltransferase [Phycisphaerae bacterium]|jgi:uracil phosphoribosyltransferase|nr:uracil phosphoribosyltransferase [Phycisphaerae bacterium]MBT5382903.1 uracil phosphoribosyltransferase [Phycisphaerae bacterium]MBT5584568.1 uracil phosphoribosyltransferase [Phycisphaerae bacterium]MBT5656377.1 uracil phosphoribosyltransferase [Phycisphaerae bacterium]